MQHDSNFDGDEVIMRVRGVSKSFPGVQAISNVSFDLRAGEVHALVGENGAGKSTLMKILAGSQHPDIGTIEHGGDLIELQSPLEAKKRGILLIHQEISLVPELSVMENIYLGSYPTRGIGWVDKARLRSITEAVIASGRYDLNPTDIVGDLSVAKQQLVEIARATAFKCSVVVFDEPTASLSNAEAEILFSNIRQLKASGVAIVYISHRMKEIFQLSQRITVLRDGVLQGTRYTAATNEDEVTRMMIGRSVSKYITRARRSDGEEVLSIQNVSVPGWIRDVSFSIRAGEVVGLYGLVGSGRSELAEAIFGLRQMSHGQMSWRGRPTKIDTATAAVELGIGFVPEDRKLQGLVLGLGGQDNLSLPLLSRLSVFGLTQRSRESALYSEYRDKLRIKSAGPSVPVRTLSGGNQQKVVLSKWLASNPRLLILDEPTRGIDIGAKAELHELVSKLAEEGMAILLISSEMPEIMGLSHRILTLYQGKITGEFDSGTVSEDEILARVMDGASALPPVLQRQDTK